MVKFSHAATVYCIHNCHVSLCVSSLYVTQTYLSLNKDGTQRLNAIKAMKALKCFHSAASEKSPC